MSEEGNPAHFKLMKKHHSLLEDIQIILKCPKRLFLKAIFHSARYLCYLTAIESNKLYNPESLIIGFFVTLHIQN
jgi:hypothetical protein